MDKPIRRIGVFTSGGDAPGMNAAIRSVVRSAIHYGIDCVGIRRGYHGLIHGDFVRLSFESVSGLSRRGGTMLYSARSDEFKTEGGAEKALATCKLLGVDALVGVGGDGTFCGLLSLARHGLPVIGIPGTIDNDIGCSSYTIGFDSACNTALECIDKLRDTMQSHERCSVVEVMGRHAGHVALNVGVACGATVVLLPEQVVDYDRDVMEPIRRSRLAGFTHFMVIVAEGVAGGAYAVAQKITEETSVDTRVTILGHVQRGGAPTSRDRITATFMGHQAVELLREGKTCRILAMKGDAYVDYDIEEALAMKKDINRRLYSVLHVLAGQQS